MMNKIQNQKINSPFEQLVSKKPTGNNKFKNILDVETDNKKNQIDSKSKNKIKSEKDKYGKDIKKDKKQTEDKKIAENEEDKEDKITNKKNPYIFLSELLNIPVEELKEMDLESLMNKLGIDLDMDTHIDGLDLNNINLEELSDLLSDIGIDLDLEAIGNQDEFINELVDKINGKVMELDNEEALGEKLSSIINKDGEIIEKDGSEKSNKLIEEVSHMNTDELKVNQEDSEEMSDDFSDEFAKEDTKNIKNTNSKRTESLDFEEISDQADLETDSEPVAFDTVVRRENDILIDMDGNIVENLEEVDQQDVIEQITSKMEFNLTEDNQEVRINLKPNHLGEMVMNLEIVEGEVAAKITVDNYKTKEILEANIMTLQEELEDTGMEIKSFEVFVGQDSDFQRHGQERFNFFNHENQFKKKNNRNKLNLISTDYEAATIEEDKGVNMIVDGTMDLQA